MSSSLKPIWLMHGLTLNGTGTDTQRSQSYPNLLDAEEI
jgi:hypothetical protein